jgi:hypothetical protein
MSDESDGPPGKKPPEPFVTEWPAGDLKARIAKQIFITLQRRGADKLLSIIQNYGDTLRNAEILLLMREYNGPAACCVGLNDTGEAHLPSRRSARRVIRAQSTWLLCLTGPPGCLLPR